MENIYYRYYKQATSLSFTTILWLKLIHISSIRQAWRRREGVFVYFEDNAGVIVNDKGEMNPTGKGGQGHQYQWVECFELQCIDLVWSLHPKVWMETQTQTIEIWSCPSVKPETWSCWPNAKVATVVQHIGIRDFTKVSCVNVEWWSLPYHLIHA